MLTANDWIKKLGLKAHPEGGYFKEVYRSSELAETLPPRFNGKRNFCTSIYFLLTSNDRSVFHRIKSDEIWHFYAGSSLTIYIINGGSYYELKLGNEPDKSESLQVVVPANSWFGAKVNEPESYVLSGCTVSPGFDFHDFEMASRGDLLQEYPHLKLTIEMLT